MAIFDKLLGIVDGARLSIEVDDVQNEVRRVKLDCTQATRAVEVTFFEAGAVGQVFKQPAQPGQDINQLVPPGQRSRFELGIQIRPDGTPVLVMIKPEYIFRRA